MSKKRVILGLSAGVDSSVAAALLKKEGYDVVCVFLHFWKEPGQDTIRENKCCSLESQQDARKVAQILDLPLYTVNAAKEFKREVVDYFLAETKAGRTPNPCVVCNERIKFNFLFRKMLEMEADYIASGHYAVVKKKEDGLYHLYTSSDEEKDQTYFLYNVNQKQLSRMLFPVGKYAKSVIRMMARDEYSLPVFNKDDSQGLCFTPEKTPSGFIKRNLELIEGPIVGTDGKRVGTHQGLELYTIGQRKGINIGGDGPYYVIGRDFGANTLLVTNDEADPRLGRKTLVVESVNWIAGEPELPKELNVKIRYRHPLVRGTIRKIAPGETAISQKEKAAYEVEFLEPQRAVTPGQSAVFYADDSEVLGGGIIV